MDRARISALLEAYGGDPARWPDAEREAALRLIEADPELGQDQKSALALDRALALAPAGEVSEALLTRILERAPGVRVSPLRQRVKRRRHTKGIRGWLPNLPVFDGVIAVRPAAVLGLAICMGLVLGALAPSIVDTEPSEVDLLTMMWGDPAFSQIGSEPSTGGES